MARILVVDNYDSFVFNIVQYLYQLGAECEVRRNDEVRVEDSAGFGNSSSSTFAQKPITLTGRPASSCSSDIHQDWHDEIATSLDAVGTSR